MTVRTLVQPGSTFHGVLTGGNGRGNPAVTSTYAFNVPGSQHDIDATVNIPDPNNGVVAYLLDPEGEAVASSSNYALDGDYGFGCCERQQFTDGLQGQPRGRPVDTRSQLAAACLPGPDLSISMPFTGNIQFNSAWLSTGAYLPSITSKFATTKLVQGKSYLYYVKYTNNTNAQQVLSLDPRTSTYGSLTLNDLNGSATDIPLPVGPPDYTYPVYGVPADTTALDTSLTGTAPVTYDVSPFPGDPDLSPALATPGVVESQSGDSASLDFTPAGGEVTPGLWGMLPSEIGPYGPSGAPAETATATASAWTLGFDSTVETETGDLWQFQNTGSPYEPFTVDPGDSTEILVEITPTASPGTTVSGTMNLDDLFTINFADGSPPFASGDELASIPYEYKVVGP